MKPYDFISNIIEDLCSEYTTDFCYVYFEDHCRHPSDLTTRHKSNRTIIGYDASQDGAAIVDPNSSPFYHHGIWKDTHKYSSSGFMKRFLPIYEHCWEPIDIDLDIDFWNTAKPGIVLHSEHNSSYTDRLVDMGFTPAHWFAHAYLCSEFYFKHYSKLKLVTDYTSRPINYPWISANRLLRDYRVEFLHNIDYTQGAYSLLREDVTGKKLWGTVPPNSFDHHGNDSAEICVDKLTPWNTSFLHIVNETVWQDRIHFTEKVFKPIVMHQPFVVLQAPGSLEYLRSYGFKTFGDFWDESYDIIEDPNTRMQAIADIVNWIPTQDLYRMRNKMSGILEHNFRHFYEKIPDIVLDELRVAIQLASS